MKHSEQVKKELNESRLKYGINKEYRWNDEDTKIYQELLKQGQKLPDDIYRNIDKEFIEVEHADLNEHEIMEYLTYKKLDMLKTIKNCILFFTILTIVSMLILIFLQCSAM